MAEVLPTNSTIPPDALETCLATDTAAEVPNAGN